MSFGSRLKELREGKDLKQQELAEILGVKNTAISNYELDISSPKEETMFKIFRFFNVTPNYMFQDDIEIKSEVLLTLQEKEGIKKYHALDEHGKKLVSFVLTEEYTRCTSEPEAEEPPTITIQHSIHKVSAGHGFDLNNEDEWEEIEVSDTPEARRADFSLTISGDSMEPIYSDGDIVLVKAQPSVDIGETGIFIVNGSGFIKKNGGDRLISLNPEYDDITFCDGDTISCAGKVIGTV